MNILTCLIILLDRIHSFFSPLSYPCQSSLYLVDTRCQIRNRFLSNILPPLFFKAPNEYSIVSSTYYTRLEFKRVSVWFWLVWLFHYYALTATTACCYLTGLLQVWTCGKKGNCCYNKVDLSIEFSLQKISLFSQLFNYRYVCR